MPWAGVYRCVGGGASTGRGRQPCPWGWVPWRLWGDSATGSPCSLGEAVSSLWASFFLPCVERGRNLAVRGAGQLSRVHLWGKCPTHPLISVLVRAFPSPAGLPESVGSVPKSGLSRRPYELEENRTGRWSGVRTGGPPAAPLAEPSQPAPSGRSAPEVGRSGGLGSVTWADPVLQE